MSINEFITQLDNRNMVFNGIYRGSTPLRVLTPQRSTLWNTIFGDTNKSEHFRIACEITLVLRNSVLAAYEVYSDSRISYTDADLADVLLGKGSDITGSSHPLEFIVTDSSPSKQTWNVTYLGGGAMESRDEDGNVEQLSGLSFSPTAWTQFNLVGSHGKAQVLNEPATGSKWVISRDENYNSQINNIAKRLDDLSIDTVIQSLPADLIGMYRVTPVLQGPLRVAAAAVGVAHVD